MRSEWARFYARARKSPDRKFRPEICVLFSRPFRLFIRFTTHLPLVLCVSLRVSQKFFDGEIHISSPLLFCSPFDKPEENEFLPCRKGMRGEGTGSR